MHTRKLAHSTQFIYLHMIFLALLDKRCRRLFTTWHQNLLMVACSHSRLLRASAS